MRFASVLTTSIAVALAPAVGTAQEMDKAIFHFSQIEVDASRSPGATLSSWHGNGWIGTDYDSLWWSTEGDRLAGSFGEMEVMLLYGHYARRFWDVVVGYRQEVEPIAQGYLTFGVMGLAPYWFEVGLFGFVSDDGRPSLRFEAENDLFITQRLILQPFLELDALVVRDDDLGAGAGLRTLDLGLRTRYEIRRKFAPYIDLRWVRDGGDDETLPGEFDADGVRLGFGVRLIY